jgi:O-acetyl-ADP-ribose deacetylase (regulator of RNase III)
MPELILDTAPIEKKIHRTVLRLQKGDLTALPVDAFVYYAREDLALGSGYGTAIQLRGGDAIKKELGALDTIRMGESVVTTAGRLKAKKIIHACGPKFHEPGLKEKLRDCMFSALTVADRNGFKTLAFPPMGAGFYGVPLPLCASVMLDAVRDFAQKETSLEEIIICVVDRREFAAFRDGIEKLQNST